VYRFEEGKDYHLTKFGEVVKRSQGGGSTRVEVEYVEVINDSGRLIKGHLQHRCPEKDTADAGEEKNTGL
jgi:hypothetical protein